ncbi:MAG: biphenyl 2,3-dioxygenase [Gallionellales bacterium GWA2_59_43]|nr:MAG: biphenyl 2,3-dioxygenase [Gallionellales bacterium GWA2_59_43]
MEITARVLFVISTFVSCIGVAGVALAAGDMTQQTPIDIKVQLSDEKNSLRFVPNKIELETGKLYRLILSNPSAEKHYFSSERLSQAVFTRKVQVNGAAGKASAEVKGIIREIEVYPNAVTEWWFVPIKAGHFGDLKCTIPGHAEAGMVGHISIK